MERSRDWMDQAEGDLRHAKSDVEGGYHDWACFSSQQATGRSASISAMAISVFELK